ncbi:MAG: hypothetical protein HY556_00635 [Euryarchaeota archaeon]|nr:hypothetical protein [Euryarchaeota archaeon]
MRPKHNRLESVLEASEARFESGEHLEAPEAPKEAANVEHRIRSVDSIARTMSIINRHPMHVKGGFAEGTDAWNNA